MAKVDQEFSNVCSAIVLSGATYGNKNRNVERKQIPSFTFRHDMKEGFPAITLKKLRLKNIITELIWFLRGDNDIEYLHENKVKIWHKDAYNFHLKQGGNLSYEEFSRQGKGSVGRNYGVQWRDFGGVDQITNLVKDMNRDVMSSRLVVVAWNPPELDQTALPPCHHIFQVVGVPLGDGYFGFELHWGQRSVDTFLGLPYNIASYALLGLVLQELTGYELLAVQGDLKCVHFYDNQYNAVEKLLNRDAKKYNPCKVSVNLPKGDSVTDILSVLDVQDFDLEGYESYPPIKVEMLAPEVPRQNGINQK